MTSNQWIQKARGNRERLLMLLTSFHPCAASMRRGDFDLPITAMAAEDACRNIRAVIAAEGGTDRDLPREFDYALAQGDVSKINNMLNEAWFGVPESTACWDIPGFSEAVALMEDPPDDWEPSEEESGVAAETEAK